MVLTSGRWSGPVHTPQKRPESLRPIRWLHVPKAGSAFINVAARFGCPELRQSNHTFNMAVEFTAWIDKERDGRECPRLAAPWNGHAPIRPAELQPPAMVRLVAMFRRPSQRLLSGFHHAEGGKVDMMIAPGMPAARREQMRRASRDDPAAYARWPGIAGCVAKMLIGRQCASERSLTDTDVAHAVFLVRERFAFVGLLESWETSVCVFHALLSPRTAIHPAELVVTHVGIHSPTLRKSNGSLVALAEWDERHLRGFADVDDERVYAAARRRFVADARRTHCARPCPGEAMGVCVGARKITDRRQ